MNNFKKLSLRVIEILPVATPAIVGVFGILAMFLLMAKVLTDILVIILGVPVVVLTFIIIYKYSNLQRPGTKREQKVVDILLLLFVLAWASFNIFYTSQHLLINRDPAIYAVTSVRIIDNSNLDFNNVSPFGEFDANLKSSIGAGFYQSDGLIYAQGQHLLPTYIGLAGRVVGLKNAFHLNILFGATAILAVFALARMMVRPRWALIGSMAFGTMYPLIYFSRDMYTEPLMASLTIGGLALLWVAKKSTSKWLWFLAGLVFGATAMNRVDAYIPLAGILVYLFIEIGLAGNYKKRVKVIKDLSVFLVGLLIPVSIGLYDLMVLTPVYYHDIFNNIKLEFLLIGFLFFAGVFFTFLSWKTKLIETIHHRTIKWRADTSVIIALLGVIFFSSRALWYVGKYKNNNALIAGLQKSGGFMVDGYRSYAEHTTDWLNWYMGSVILFLGIVGLVIVIRIAVTKKNMLYIPFIAVMILTFVAYMYSPNISPDQPWASRRLLSVVIPGIVVFSTIGLNFIDKKMLPMLSRQLRAFALIVVLVLVFFQPMRITRIFAFERTFMQYNEVQDVCSVLSNLKNPSIMWVGTAEIVMPMTINVNCDVPSIGIYTKGRGFPIPSLSRKGLAQAYKNARLKGKLPVIGLFGSQINIIKNVNISTTEVGVYKTKIINRTLENPPNSVVEGADSIVLGIIDSTGLVWALEGSNSSK